MNLRAHVHILQRFPRKRIKQPSHSDRASRNADAVVFRTRLYEELHLLQKVMAAVFGLLPITFVLLASEASGSRGVRGAHIPYGSW